MKSGWHERIERITTAAGQLIRALGDVGLAISKVHVAFESLRAAVAGRTINAAWKEVAHGGEDKGCAGQ